jgi:uncharacterized membrane protein HdeD (DUF308 family)
MSAAYVLLIACGWVFLILGIYKIVKWIRKEKAPRWVNIVFGISGFVTFLPALIGLCFIGFLIGLVCAPLAEYFFFPTKFLLGEFLLRKMPWW